MSLSQKESEGISLSIDTAVVVSWNSKRKIADDVATILTDNGNKFSFQLGNDAAYAIHCYIGYDNITGKINFQIIKAAADTKSNTHAIAACPVDAHKVSLPSMPNQDPDPNNPNYISWADASARISNYIDTAKRNSWINHQFKGDATDAIFQAFVLDSVNFQPGCTYDCYLGLKEEEEIYTADLIVANTTIDESSASNIISLRDLATLVPPYKPHGKTSFSKFGVLQNL